MIQKRYQFQGKSGIEWTDYFDYEENDSLLSSLQTKDKYQAKNLKNEYRIV